jgi:hypothetical protein
LMARKKKPPEGAKFHSVRVEGVRVLLTIGPGDDVWTDGSVPLPAVPSGSIVRIEPPEAADDGVVEQVRMHAAATALSARVLPRRRAAVVVAPKDHRPHASARNVVCQMATEANVADRFALQEVLDRIMDAEGL